MKYKMSISISEESIAKIQSMIRTRRFRNKSHAIEYAIEQFEEDE